MMCAWSVSRSISALHSRGLGMTCDHSEKGRFVVTITAAFSAAASVHLIAQVKANQPALHHAIVALCDTAAPVDSTQTADKKRRCRDETRTVEVFAPGGSLADTEWDGHIRAIIRVNRDVTHPLRHHWAMARYPCLSATSCCQPLNVPKPSVATAHRESLALRA